MQNKINFNKKERRNVLFAITNCAICWSFCFKNNIISDFSHVANNAVGYNINLNKNEKEMKRNEKKILIYNNINYLKF